MQSDTCVDSIPLNSPLATSILCYPRPEHHCAERAARLESAGVSLLCSWGRTLLPTLLGSVRVLGKGHSSVVVLGYSPWHGLVAVKSRRSDSKRESLEEEYRLLESASRVGAAPRAFHGDHDLIVMEYISGPTLEEVLEAGPAPWAILEALEAAWALDTAGILHLELSKPRRHILYSGYHTGSKALIIDYESARAGECGNLPRVTGYLLARTVGTRFLTMLRPLLRAYREEGCPTQLYRDIIRRVAELLDLRSTDR